MTPGDTFFGLDFGGHLWVVLSETTAAGRIAVANLTTHDPGRRRNCDRACEIIHPGDHPFITRASCIYRKGAELTNATRLQKNIEAGVFETHAPLQDDLLTRIQAALVASPRTPREVKDAISEAN